MNSFETPQEVFVVTGDFAKGQPDDIAVPYATAYVDEPFYYEPTEQPYLSPMDFPSEQQGPAASAESLMSDTSVNLALLNMWNRRHPEDGNPESSVSKMRASLNQLAETAITAVGSSVRASANDLLSSDQIDALRETLAAEANGESDWSHPDVMSNIALAGLLLKHNLFQQSEGYAPTEQRTAPTSHRKGGPKHAANRSSGGRHRA